MLSKRRQSYEKRYEFSLNRLSWVRNSNGPIDAGPIDAGLCHTRNYKHKQIISNLGMRRTTVSHSRTTARRQMHTGVLATAQTCARHFTQVCTPWSQVPVSSHTKAHTHRYTPLTPSGRLSHTSHTHTIGARTHRMYPGRRTMIRRDIRRHIIITCRM